MLLPSMPQHKVDPARLAFDIFPYAPDRVTVAVFEKDKGGTGGTGTAMTAIELFLWLGLHVHIVDLADTQLDLAVPYEDIEGVIVHQVDEAQGEAGTVFRAITRANPGEIVVVQYPGSAVQRIDRLHQLLVHAQSRVSLPVGIAIIWTMDRDQNSRDLLTLTLDTKLPGTLHVNWPVWNGAPNIPESLAARMADQNGVIFSMPALDGQFYDAFKAERTAPRTAYLQRDFVTQAMLDFWLTSVAAAVGARW